jgi:3-deoxy-D-manno-octulosonic-acid transferase
MSLLYHFSITLYSSLIKLASIFNAKAKAWVNGRRGWQDEVLSLFDDTDRVAWFHAASLGEFEQGRPVIEAFRKRYPDFKILLTFFSPSGYEQKKNYEGADHVMYLPADTRSNATHFIGSVRPAIAFFIKYEFWYNYLEALNKNRIPVVFISVLFRKGQPFFQWYGGWFRSRLKRIDHFFVQNEASVGLLSDIDIKNVTLSGDTRFDRVVDILNEKNEIPEIREFCKGHSVLLAGSTWPADEELLSVLPDEFPDIKFIIAPHEVREERIVQIMKTMGIPAARYTKDDPGSWQDKRLLVIDTIGILSSIYRYAHMAYIGGAFGAGLHNIQEPAVNGMPVIFGPKYDKFREAVDLVELGGAFSITSRKELKDVLLSLQENISVYEAACKTNSKYMLESTGATEKIMQGISSYL